MPSSHPYWPGYAIFRIDNVKSKNEEECDWNLKVNIKKVVATVNEAEEEIMRLTELNEEKGCLYLWQYTRIENPQDFGTS